MQGLVDCRGDDDIHIRRRKFSDLADAGVFLSLAPRVDVFFPPLKRARVSAPFVLGDWNKLVASPRKDFGPSSIDVLKDECLMEVLKRLDGDRDRSIAACVSKRWLRLLATAATSPKSESPKKSLPDLNETAKSVDDIDEEDEEEDAISSRCLEGTQATDLRLLSMAIGSSGRGGVGKLSIRSSGRNQLTDLGLGAIALHSPNLKSLSIWNAAYITDKGLSQIAVHCPLLEKLDLVRCPLVTDKGISAVVSKCRSLTSLAIESCPNVGDDCMWAVGHFCSSLSSITISDSKIMGDKGIASLLSSSHLPSLHKVTFRRLSLTDLSMAVLGHYGKAITDLTLTELPNVTERGLWVMGCTRGLKNLRSLTLRHCGGATDLGLEAVARGCPSLKKLALQDCPLLSDSGLQKLATSLSLETLQLEDCSLISLPGVVASLLALGEGFQSLSIVRCNGFKNVCHAYPSASASASLRSLSVSDCAGFGDAGLLILGKLCKNLRRIQLCSLPCISDAGLLLFFRDCGRAGLTTVKLGGCESVSDAAVAMLTKRHGRTLRSLHVPGCKRVTDRGAVAVAESCFQLEDLDLSRSSITDAGVAAVAGSNGSRLRVLSLGGCDAVSGKSLVDLGSRCGSLAGLNVQLCDSITDHDLATFQSRMARCDVLF